MIIESSGVDCIVLFHKNQNAEVTKFVWVHKTVQMSWHTSHQCQFQLCIQIKRTIYIKCMFKTQPLQEILKNKMAIKPS